MTQPQLSRIESGPPLMNIDRLGFWAELLGVPHDRLWFTPPGAPAHLAVPLPDLEPGAPSDGEAGWGPVVTIERARRVAGPDRSALAGGAGTGGPVDATRGRQVVDRRQATRTIVGAVLGSVLLEQVEPWLSTSAATGPSSKAEESRPAGLTELDVEQLEHTARLYRTWDDQHGGGLKRMAVAGLLDSVADELDHRSHAAEATRRLFGVVADLAETAATMSWDSGDGIAAQRYYLLALRAAADAGDRELGANILAGMARQLYYLDRPAEGLELIRLAQDGIGSSATPATRSMLYTREAWAYAAQGRLTAFQRTTSKAEDAFAEIRPGDVPHWLGYFDRAELAGVTGGRLLAMADHRPELAVTAAGYIEHAVEARRPQCLRSSALDQLGLAEAHLIRGELDEAARCGHEALDVVEQTPSGRVRAQVADLYHRTGTCTSAAAVTRLRDRIEGLPPLVAAAAV